MSHFSSVLQLTDLDDFIAPSQECIIPTNFAQAKPPTGAKIQIASDGYYANDLKGEGFKKIESVQISLTDCLACSGCITSAESVLISQQSQEELLRVLESNKQTHKQLIIVSMSIQPILSIAHYFNMNPNECAAKLITYFMNLGCDFVVNTAVAEDLTIIELQQEFLHKVGTVKPLFSSSCPGWVCYAEKTHSKVALQNIATTRSPQQVIGALLKHSNWTHRPIYHVALMPCFDKKLEASRSDFINSVTGDQDVNCVITAVEVQQMLASSGTDLSKLSSSNFHQPWSRLCDDSIEEQTEPKLTRLFGSASGGYCDAIFRYAAKHLYNQHLTQEILDYQTVKNVDLREVTLEVDGIPALRFAIANGFRNIQNLMQKMKRNKCTYDFVEIMACPSGCLNGGAQIRPKDGSSVKQLTDEIQLMYDALPVRDPNGNIMVQQLYQTWLEQHSLEKCDKYLHTQYHAVTKSVSAINIKW